MKERLGDSWYTHVSLACEFELWIFVWNWWTFLTLSCNICDPTCSYISFIFGNSVFRFYVWFLGKHPLFVPSSRPVLASLSCSTLFFAGKWGLVWTGQLWSLALHLPYHLHQHRWVSSEVEELASDPLLARISTDPSYVSVRCFRSSADEI